MKVCASVIVARFARLVLCDVLIVNLLFLQVELLIHVLV